MAMVSPSHDLSKLLVIRERDVGLFSMVLQVLNTLHVLEDQQIDRVPVALFGRGLLYFHAGGLENRRTVWEYYFEPLVQGVGEEPLLALLGERALDLLESKRKELELIRGAADFPEDLHLVEPLNAADRSNLDHLRSLASGCDWVWTEAFQPTIDGRKPSDFQISHDRGAALVHRYVRPRRHIRHRADALYDSQLAGYYVIGVHVRGTDGFGAPARGVETPFDRYFHEIEKRLRAVGRDACRVFLATDEEAFVSRFEERFGPLLVYCDTVRNVEGDEIFGSGPTGQVMPGYIAKDGASAVANGEDAVVEYTLLTRSDFLVRNFSSLSLAASYSVPESVYV